MRLFEAIVDANHRAAGGGTASLRPDDFAGSLPIVALTCIDPRLNALLPGLLGVAPEHFIWLRNAGNIITGPVSSTMRSIALACAVKGGREIAIIGHTDCRVQQTTASDLIDRFGSLGIARAKLPDDVHEFFGLFASERSNVLKAAGFVRQSPIIGAAIPVHGLLVDIRSGRIEWLVNGYSTLGSPTAAPADVGSASGKLDLPGFNIGEMKFPETKIGDAATRVAPAITHEAPPPDPPAIPAKPKAPQPPPVPPGMPRGLPKKRGYS